MILLSAAEQRACCDLLIIRWQGPAQGVAVTVANENQDGGSGRGVGTTFGYLTLVLFYFPILSRVMQGSFMNIETGSAILCILHRSYAQVNDESTVISLCMFGIYSFYYCSYT